MLRSYLHERHFQVVTHQNVLYWKARITSPSVRLARCAPQLQEYDYAIVYRSGSRHQDGDPLLRAPLHLLYKEDTADFPQVLLDSVDMAHPQSLHPVICKINTALNYTSQDTSRDRSYLRNYVLRASVLFKKNFDSFGWHWLLVLPRNLRADVLRAF